MGNRNATFGTDRERKVLYKLRDDDWLAIRTPGSKGAMDIIALRDGSRPRVIQVKGTAAGPFSDFGPAAREALRLAARLAGAEAWLVHWPRHGQMVWIPEADWP